MFSNFRMHVHIVCVFLLSPSSTKFCTLDTRGTQWGVSVRDFSLRVPVNRDKVSGLHSTQ